MDMSSTIRRGHPAAFAVFIVLSLIVAIIASAVVADLNKHDDTGYDSNLVRDTTRFMGFTGWWSFLVGVLFVRLPLRVMASILTCTAGSFLDGHGRCRLVDCCSRSRSFRHMGVLALRFCGPVERCGQHVLQLGGPS
mgnify:FL=1